MKKAVIFIVLVLIVAAGICLVQFGGKLKALSGLDKAGASPSATATPSLNPDEYQPPLPSVDGVALGKRLLGDWTMKSSDEPDPACKTGYEVKFSEENGQKVYQSWQHCRPLDSGTWSLDGDTITLNVPRESGWQEKVYLETDDFLWFGNVGQFERVQ